MTGHLTGNRTEVQESFVRRHLMTARIDQRNGTGNGTIYHAPEAKHTSVKSLQPEHVYSVDNSPFPAKTKIATISLKNPSENHDPYIILMLKIEKNVLLVGMDCFGCVMFRNFRCVLCCLIHYI